MAVVKYLDKYLSRKKKRLTKKTSLRKVYNIVNIWCNYDITLMYIGSVFISFENVCE